MDETRRTVKASEPVIPDGEDYPHLPS